MQQFINIESFVTHYKLGLLHEEKFTCMEETGQDALEMAKKENEEEKESPEDEEAVNPLISFTQGVWGSPVSLRAPVIFDG